MGVVNSFSPFKPNEPTPKFIPVMLVMCFCVSSATKLLFLKSLYETERNLYKGVTEPVAIAPAVSSYNELFLTESLLNLTVLFPVEFVLCRA